VGGFPGGLGADGGLADGGSEELDEFIFSRASNSATRRSSITNCARNWAMIASRSRHPAHCGPSIPPLSSHHAKKYNRP
jgi:hypothetical protein